MNKQELIEKLADDMAKAEGQFDSEYFIMSSIVSVNLFWPLVEAGEKLTTSCFSGTSVDFMNHIDAANADMIKALSNLKGESK